VPDWSYGTILRPILFRLPPERARDLTLRAIGGLGRLPGGAAVIDLLGHMAPPEALQTTAFDRSLPSPVGLAAEIDPEGTATRALSRFGFGFIEVGPVASGGPAGRTEIDPAAGEIAYGLPVRTVDPEVLKARLGRPLAYRTAVVVRLGHASPTPDDAAIERERAIEMLAPVAAAFTLETRDDVIAGSWSMPGWEAHLDRVLAAARRAGRGLLVAIPPDADGVRACDLAQRAMARGAQGVAILGGVQIDGRLVLGTRTREMTLALVRDVRATVGPQPTVVASGGVIEPLDALALLDSGASLVALDSGLVLYGPGLPKRVNDALAFRRRRPDMRDERAGLGAWVWALLLGLGLIVAGALAWSVAATTAVLPYEESFVGLSRAEMAAIDDRLPAFMAHDRTALAAGMVSVGYIYGALAWFAVRRGERWAAHALTASAVVGFASFFLFLGYRYFDPLHACVSLLLLPFLVLFVRRPLPPPDPSRANLRSDRRWRLGLWGQLAFVAIGVGLTLGGAIICILGTTTVFVPSDLEFLRISRSALDQADPELVPLIAHDRAGLGGLLFAEGIGVLLISLWGFREGARWLWWTYLIAGLVGFAGALGVHQTIGYLDPLHLAPAYVGLMLFAAGLSLSFAYLWAPASS